MKHDAATTFFENLILLLLLVFALAVLIPGCATMPITAVTSGSDNATLTAAAPALTAVQLIQYAGMAEQEALAAWQLYESTKDATALEKVTWWLKYASGVAEKIEALSVN